MANGRVLDLDELICNVDFADLCKEDERAISRATFVNIPEEEPSPEEAFRECCYYHFVLADPDSNEDYKNDYSSFYHQSQLGNENPTFFLVDMKNAVEIELQDETFGKIYPQGSLINAKLSGYLIEWRKVFLELGSGPYQIIKRYTVAGIPLESFSFVFTLKRFSSLLADSTVKIETVMNGVLQEQNIDFTGTNWKDSIRIKGFFGRREPQLEEDYIVFDDYSKHQVSMKQTNEYKFQVSSVPNCVTNKIWDYHLLSNEIFVTDYNLNNHSYSFVKRPVKYESNEGTGYHSQSRRATLNITFSDRIENNLKRNYR